MFFLCVYSSNHSIRVPNEKFLLYRRLPVLKEKFSKLDGHLLQEKKIIEGKREGRRSPN